MFRPLQKISWKKCIKATEKKFKYALGHIYVKEKELEGKTTEDIEDVLEIISKIQKSLEDRLSNTTWMDADTKGKASAKSKLIRSLGIVKLVEREILFISKHLLSVEYKHIDKVVNPHPQLL